MKHKSNPCKSIHLNNHALAVCLISTGDTYRFRVYQESSSVVVVHVAKAKIRQKTKVGEFPSVWPGSYNVEQSHINIILKPSRSHKKILHRLLRSDSLRHMRSSTNTRVYQSSKVMRHRRLLQHAREVTWIRHRLSSSKSSIRPLMSSLMHRKSFKSSLRSRTLVLI